MNTYTTLMLGVAIAAVSCAFGAERAPESKTAPDIAEVRQILGNLLTNKAETDIVNILDDETLRIFSKDAEYIVKVEDGALLVTEYGIDGKPIRAQRGSHKQVDGRSVWVDDQGWVVRKQERIPSNVKKEALRQVRERMLGNLVLSEGMGIGSMKMLEPCGGIWVMGNDRIDLGIWMELKDPNGEISKVVMSCSCYYRDGKWEIEGVSC